ncbi:hypothetical protein NUW58_g3283 [Xylaria curta]|uniref:Uncharacterized protein n=1 Tax=Xylaria curta TaxID=42375 RepID=A0ACC1PBR2_9PEZI|nr:hypothetical protein NUW58_g3283 [Xylaria curta]
MTKPWDLHEATIKKLYAEHTLAVVQKIMMEKYNFKASTRAYRGRLIKWGVRKYNCRRQIDNGMMSPDSQDGSVSGSETASPSLSQTAIERDHDLDRYSTGGNARDSETRMSNAVGRSYDAMDMETSRAITEKYAIHHGLPIGTRAKFPSYGRTRALASPPQEIQYAWSVSPTQSTSPPAVFGHPDLVGAPGRLYGYPPLSPPSTVYSPAAYESDQINRDRRQSFPLVPAPQYTTVHNGTAYSPIRDYGNGHASGGMDSYDTRHNQVSKYGPKH